jgi:isoquinoline 1-oxidoreductase beta subunit
VKRRQFMAGGAAALNVSFAGCGAIPVIPKRPQPTAEDALGWVRYHEGRFELLVPCAEMGQHIGQALRRIAALELGVPAALIGLRLPSTRDMARVKATVGSDSVKDFALPLAQACATLRDALAAGVAGGKLKASERPAEQLRSLRGGRAGLPGAPAAGGGEEPAFLRDIVTGLPLYAADMRLPGMVYGRVLRAPVSPELQSRPAAWDEAAARAVPGFVAVVADPVLRHAGSLGLGVVARTPGALDRTEQALAVRWQVEGGFDPEQVEAALDIDGHLRRGALRHALRRDEPAAPQAWTVDLRLDLPFAAHASIEPRAALAAIDVGAGGSERLQVFTGTQDLFYVRDTLARRLSMGPAQVHVQACRIGGGFGARTLVWVELEAALLARSVRLPVKVMWTRQQEFTQGFHRPPSSHRIRARVQAGRLTDWWHAFTSSHILFTPAAMPVWMQRAADFVGDQGVARGAKLPYGVPRQRIEFDALRLPVHSGPWRGLGAGPNGLAVEMAIDACARAAGADALAFRLAHTGDARLQAVLRAVAADARWPAAGAPAGPGQRRGRGLACGIYKDASRVAVVADVEVGAGGEVRATALWCAHDCGLVIDPDGVRAQVEGCLVWCLGLVLVEELPLARSGVAASGFADAPIPRFGQVPPLRVRLVESAAAPSGAGESAMAAGAAAIANAVFDATGVRATRMPIRPATLHA